MWTSSSICQHQIHRPGNATSFRIWVLPINFTSLADTKIAIYIQSQLHQAYHTDWSGKFCVKVFTSHLSSGIEMCLKELGWVQNATPLRFCEPLVKWVHLSSMHPDLECNAPGILGTPSWKFKVLPCLSMSKLFPSIQLSIEQPRIHITDYLYCFSI